MSDDIVTRLREAATYIELLSDDLVICDEAAAEIERLRALDKREDEIERLLAENKRLDSLLIRQNAVMSSDDIVTRDVTDPWQEICDLRDEIERLLAAIDTVLRAITDKGSHPEYHDEVRRRHEREWPTLWRAIAGLREARRG